METDETGTIDDKRRRFLVVVDETPECDKALYFAGRRALATGGEVLLLRIFVPSDFQHWLGVENIMREDAEGEAIDLLDQAGAKLKHIGPISFETAIREGQPADTIKALIEEDNTISLLVLGAGAGTEGPGPLVSLLGRTGGAFPIPVTIVPGSLTKEEMDLLT